MTNEQKKELLKKFILENKLEFGEGSRNTPATIISGYALFIEASAELIIETLENLSDAAESLNENYNNYDNTEETDDEIKRVFAYAKINNYGAHFEKESAKKEYKY